MSESGLFKDWFDERAARVLGDQVAEVETAFDADRYVETAIDGLVDLELMERVRQFARALRDQLDGDVSGAFDVLRRSLPPVLAEQDPVKDGTDQWPIGEFVAQYGVEHDGTMHLDAGMELMTELTQRYTSEFAVRPFLAHAPDDVFPRLEALTDHPSVHVRRWCSEGTRPRLPWGARLDGLVADPSPILPILEALRDDPEEYVRRSVANNLNDIAKDHPDLVVDIAVRWLDGASKDRGRLVRHALRSLIKAAHPGALAALGYAPPRDLGAALRVAPDTIEIGETVALELDLSPAEDADLMVDLRVHYVKANGSTSPKVFKWTKRSVRAGESTTLTKDLALVPRSIRRLYPGRHVVDVQVNGAIVAEAAFDLR